MDMSVMSRVSRRLQAGRGRAHLVFRAYLDTPFEPVRTTAALPLKLNGRDELFWIVRNPPAQKISIAVRRFS